MKYLYVCNEVLSKKDILNNYLWTHPGEKPHICEVHNKTFSEKDNLNKYIWTQFTKIHMFVKYVRKDFSSNMTSSSIS